MSQLTVLDWIAIALGALLVGTALHDILQRRHAVTRNFPIIGHVRYMLEAVGPEIRQYIVTSNDEERPFSRDQRRWVYASAKRENNYFGFGTDNDIERPGYVLVRVTLDRYMVHQTLRIGKISRAPAASWVPRRIWRPSR